MTSTSTPAPPLRWQGPDGVVIVGEERYRRLDGPIYYSGPVRRETAEERFARTGGLRWPSGAAIIDGGVGYGRAARTLIDSVPSDFFMLEQRTAVRVMRDRDELQARLRQAVLYSFDPRPDISRILAEQLARQVDAEVTRSLARSLAGTRPASISAGVVIAPPATEGENSAQLPGISLAAPIVPIKHAKKAAAQWKNELTRIRKGGR